MDLGKARVGEKGPPSVGAPRRGDIAAHRVGGQEVGVAVSTGREDDGIGEMGLDPAGRHVPDDHAASSTLDHDQVEHLVARVHPHGAGRDLPLQRLVGPE